MAVFTSHFQELNHRICGLKSWFYPMYQRSTGQKILPLDKNIVSANLRILGFLHSEKPSMLRSAFGELKETFVSSCIQSKEEPTDRVLVPPVQNR